MKLLVSMIIKKNYQTDNFSLLSYLPVTSSAIMEKHWLKVVKILLYVLALHFTNVLPFNEMNNIVISLKGRTLVKCSWISRN